MAMDGISKTNGTQKATQNQKASTNKKADAKYGAKQQELAKQIISPRNINDLKSNAKIKQQQIQLAQKYGDVELANKLQKELNEIKSDIKRNETSIFDDKNKNKDK